MRKGSILLRRSGVSAAPSSDDLFRNVAANFIQRHVKQHNSKRYGRDVVTMLGKDVLPRWGDRRIQDITKRDVLDLTHADHESVVVVSLPIAPAVDREKVICLRAIECKDIVSQLASGNRQEARSKRPSRDRVLDDAEIKSLWLACDRVPLWGPITKILLLTPASAVAKLAA